MKRDYARSAVEVKRDETLKPVPRPADQRRMLRLSAFLSALGFAISLAALLGKAAAGTRRS
jgi:hypothetical protein